TDSQGRTVDFRNTIIVLTSNLGAQLLTAPGASANDELVKAEVMKVVRQSFRPEFLNRLDETLFFDRLAPDVMDRIVDIQMQLLADRLAQRDIEVTWTEAARLWCPPPQAGDPARGAGPVGRAAAGWIGQGGGSDHRRPGRRRHSGHESRGRYGRLGGLNSHLRDWLTRRRQRWVTPVLRPDRGGR
ncbi:MAG: AAA family ATPase, partial [Alphaproteobacteria bacterium]